MSRDVAGHVGRFAIGRAVRHRSAMAEELRARTEELRQLRDDRAALVVADDRARLSRELDQLLRDRLAQLSAVAESGAELDADRAREQWLTACGRRWPLEESRLVHKPATVTFEQAAASAAAREVTASPAHLVAPRIAHPIDVPATAPPRPPVSRRG